MGLRSGFNQVRAAISADAVALGKMQGRQMPDTFYFYPRLGFCMQFSLVRFKVCVFFLSRLVALPTPMLQFTGVELTICVPADK